MDKQDKQENPEEQARENSAAEETWASSESNPPRNAKERLYDKIPLTYRQVDTLTKVLIALLAVVLLVGIATGNRG